MLRHHLHRVTLAHVRVQRVAQALEERGEARAHLGVGAHEIADALDMPLRDARDVVGPLVPVDARAAPLHELCAHRSLPALHWEQRQPQLHALGDLGRLEAVPLLARQAVAVVPALVRAVVGHLVLPGLLQEAQLVDAGLDALVVRAQGLQHAPHVGEDLGVVQRLLGAHARGDEDGQDDVAQLLALRAAHDAAHRLHHVDRGVLGVEEDDGVEVGHVDALGKASGVCEDAALPLRHVLPQPGDKAGAHVRRHGAVHMVQLAVEDGPLVRSVFHVAVHYLVESLADGLGGLDGGAEAHRAAQRPGARVEPVHVVHNERVAQARGVPGRPLPVVGQALPTADDLAHVLGVQRQGVHALVVDGHEPLAQGVLLHGEHDDLVVGEEALLHGLAELDLVGGGAVYGLVVHGGYGVVLLGPPSLGRLSVDARGRRHVEALPGAHVLVVVHLHERGGHLGRDARKRRARRAVCLVADN